jgi:hypothetical protein
MSKRACIAQAGDKKAVHAIKSKLPDNIEITAQRELFDTVGYELRFEGDGLPVWCHAPGAGEQYRRAVVQVADDGLHFSPGTGVPMNQIACRIQE